MFLSICVSTFRVFRDRGKFKNKLLGKGLIRILECFQRQKDATPKTWLNPKSGEGYIPERRDWEKEQILWPFFLLLTLWNPRLRSGCRGLVKELGKAGRCAVMGAEATFEVYHPSGIPPWRGFWLFRRAWEVLQARLLPLHDSCPCRPVLQAGEATELGPKIRSTATRQQEPPVQNEYEQDSSDEEVSSSQLLVVVRQWWRLWLRGVKGVQAPRPTEAVCCLWAMRRTVERALLILGPSDAGRLQPLLSGEGGWKESLPWTHFRL